MTAALLAMAPPMPLGGKLVVALIMFVLGAILCGRGLKWRWRTPPFAAVFVCIAVLVVLEMALPSSPGGGLHDRGILAAVVGAVSGALSVRWSVKGRADSIPDDRRSQSVARRLYIVALVSGPAMGACLFEVSLQLGYILPVDAAFFLSTYVFLGFVAGGIGCGIILAVRLLQRRPAKNEEGHRPALGARPVENTPY